MPTSIFPDDAADHEEFLRQLGKEDNRLQSYVRTTFISYVMQETPFIDRYRTIRRIFLHHYARRNPDGSLDEREIWPFDHELPKKMKEYKKDLITQVKQLCVNYSNPRQTACQFVAFATRSRPVSLLSHYCFSDSSSIVCNLIEKR